MSDHSPPEAAQGGIGPAEFGKTTSEPDRREASRQDRMNALEAAVRTHKPGMDTADHVVQAARKYLDFLRGEA